MKPIVKQWLPKGVNNTTNKSAIKFKKRMNSHQATLEV